MKKTMIIALLAVLVLGAFTACNGDVNAELAGSGEKRVITLQLDNGYKFNNDTDTLVMDIPSGCGTWTSLKTAGCQITMKIGEEEIPMNLDSYTIDSIEYAGFKKGAYLGRIYLKSKGADYQTIDGKIEIGGIYGIYIVVGN